MNTFRQTAPLWIIALVILVSVIVLQVREYAKGGSGAAEAKHNALVAAGVLPWIAVGISAGLGWSPASRFPMLTSSVWAVASVALASWNAGTLAERLEITLYRPRAKAQIRDAAEIVFVLAIQTFFVLQVFYYIGRLNSLPLQILSAFVGSIVGVMATVMRRHRQAHPRPREA